MGQWGVSGRRKESGNGSLSYPGDGGSRYFIGFRTVALQVDCKGFFDRKHFPRPQLRSEGSCVDLQIGEADFYGTIPGPGEIIKKNPPRGLKMGKLLCYNSAILEKEVHMYAYGRRAVGAGGCRDYASQDLRVTAERLMRSFF